MLTAIDRLIQVLSQRHKCAPALLLEVWATASAGVSAAARVAQDLEYIWAKEGELLAPLPTTGPIPLPYGQGIISMYWWARFQALRQPAELSPPVRQGIIAFFGEPLSTFSPDALVQLSALRLWKNSSGQLSLGGAILQGGGTFYALYGPLHPQRDLVLQPERDLISAVNRVLQGTTEVVAQFPLLAPAGAIDWSGESGYALWEEVCPSCGSSLGPRRVCYTCQPEVPPPPLLTPAEYGPRREQLKTAISERLAAQGLLPPAVVKRTWQTADLQSVVPPATVWADTLAVAKQVELTSTELATLDWEMALVLANLHRLAQAATTGLQPQEQAFYQAVVAQDWSRVAATAQEHDALAEDLAHPRRLRPLAAHLPTQVAQGASLPRPLLYLIAAQHASAGTTATLTRRLARLPAVEQVPILKALQWLAPAEPAALQTLTTALQSDWGITRVGAAFALAGAAALGSVPPTAVLTHCWQADWHPYVRQAAGEALAVAGRPPCPWCGELLSPTRWPHSCCQDASADEWEELWRGYLGAACGRQPHPIAQALARLWEQEAALERVAAVDILQSSAATPPERIAAVSTVLHNVTIHRPAADLTPLLRSPIHELAELVTHLLVYTDTPLPAPEWGAAWRANMATLATHGHLALAAACIPRAAWDRPTAEGLRWFLRQGGYCPACGQWPRGKHSCAPSEVQQQALWHLELRIGSAHLRHHPLACYALLCHYHDLAALAGLPPHPWLPLLPPVPESPLADGGDELLVASSAEAQLQAWEMLGTASPTVVLLIGAALVGRQDTPAAVQQAVLTTLHQHELAYCPACQRFTPVAWGHQCPPAASASQPAGLPDDWQPLYADAETALGQWLAVPEGEMFAYALGQSADWLVPTGYSALHVVPAATADDIGRGAMLVQVAAESYAVYGPAEGQIVFEQCADLRTAYELVLRFLS